VNGDADEDGMVPLEDLAEILEFELDDHVPLGCTVEESLAVTETDGLKHVFVSRVTEGGNAARAGIQVGDVVTGLSGVFGEVEDVAGLGLGRVKDLVRGRPREESLTIRVARGTDIYSRHEDVLMGLCEVSNYRPSGNDPALDDCLNTIMTSDKFDDDDPSTDVAECSEDDPDCMVDALFDIFAEDLPDEMIEKERELKDGKKDVEKTKKKKVAPWSSRSSPSGTYVRDPATGKLRNIDEEY